MAKQEQFLDVVDRDVAERRFRDAIGPIQCDSEKVTVVQAWGRVLTDDVLSPIDVPGFDRSNYDGYAVVASDTYSADEQTPIVLQLHKGVAAAGSAIQGEVVSGQAMPIATGGMVPRGANAVVLIEYADEDGCEVVLRRSVAEGFGIAYAGSDVALGECVLRQGSRITSRETGVLAAIGVTEISVVRRPRIAILSTGDEVVAPGQPLAPGQIYDSNGQILADAVRELGGEPVRYGIVADDLAELERRVATAIDECDVVLLSGGTSKGQGDLCYRVVSQFDDPGIVAHGVALKPGKPICLAVTGGKPLVVLPGFPTSAIFTFHEFVAPVIRRLAGGNEKVRTTIQARLPVKVLSEIGRTEFLLVSLVHSNDDSLPLAFPMGKGSGSVTTFSGADGFVVIDRHTEMVDVGHLVLVQLLGRDVPIADLVVIGSHCVGLDYLLGQLQQRGFTAKSLVVGSTAGLDAVASGQADLAGIHLLDPSTGRYNETLLPEGVCLIHGYRRRQGVVYRRGDGRFAGRTAEDILRHSEREPSIMMVNRNAGSGTRILLDQYLSGRRPSGYAMQSRSHNAVVQAVKQGRADWGVAIERVARQAGLAFEHLADEHFDFAVRTSKLETDSILAFKELLCDRVTTGQLAEMGFLQFATDETTSVRQVDSSDQ
ncbi:MAG TPA: molybdopterin biosynthesis protein [Planctomycetaceae bacterium]|nr:molybdopterin biosynthesis protein [Planctomycetaceae bacterium]